jgi:hypothetical protein
MSTPPVDSPAGQLRTALRGYGNEQTRLDAIAALKTRLAEEEEQIAFAMRLRGEPWEDIAAVFGITRQAAHKRFAKSAGLLDRLTAAKTRM